MGLSSQGGLPKDSQPYADVAAAIPGEFISTGDFAGAARTLETLAFHIESTGVIPVSAHNSAPDPIASLWFIRAAHLFAEASGDRTVVGKLLPQSKRILQDFIAGRGLAGVKMDDGGLLLNAPDQPAALGLRLNVLWYSALESTACDLTAAGDKAGDHFERLAGRFRRAFAKTYWCEGHTCVCPPYARMPESHGELPDAEQLLLTVLPASPIPRTKQRQLLQVLREKTLGNSHGAVGLFIDHATLGRVESLLHRAWLAMGVLNTAENPMALAAEARAIMAPLQSLHRRGGSASFPAYFAGGQPVTDGSSAAFATAEIRAALHRLDAMR